MQRLGGAIPLLLIAGLAVAYAPPGAAKSPHRDAPQRVTGPAKPDLSARKRRGNASFYAHNSSVRRWRMALQSTARQQRREPDPPARHPGKSHQCGHREERHRQDRGSRSLHQGPHRRFVARDRPQDRNHKADRCCQGRGRTPSGSPARRPGQTEPAAAGSPRYPSNSIELPSQTSSARPRTEGVAEEKRDGGRLSRLTESASNPPSIPPRSRGVHPKHIAVRTVTQGARHESRA